MKYILLCSNNRGSTPGHWAIERCVRSAAALLEPTHDIVVKAMELGSDDILSFIQSHRSDIVCVLTDFPDIGGWSVISDLIHVTRPNRIPWIYLSMVTNLAWLREQSTRADILDDMSRPPNYDVVVSLEPGAGRMIIDPDGVLRIVEADAKIPPLVQFMRSLGHTRSLLDGASIDVRPGTILVATSGRPGERDYTEKWIRDHYSNNPVLLGRSLPQVLRPAEVARLPNIVRVIATTGYSTFWELYMAGVTDKVSWIHMQRPVEYLSARVSLLQQEKAAILLDSRAGRMRRELLVNEGVPSRGVSELAAIIERTIDSAMSGTFLHRSQI